MDINCVVCHNELTGGLDTFGDVGLEMCWTCYSQLFDDAVSDLVILQAIQAEGGKFIPMVKDDPQAYNHEVT